MLSSKLIVPAHPHVSSVSTVWSAAQVHALSTFSTTETLKEKTPFLISSHILLPGACAAAAAASTRGMSQEGVETRHACGYTGQC